MISKNRNLRKFRTSYRRIRRFASHGCKRIEKKQKEITITYTNTIEGAARSLGSFAVYTEPKLLRKEIQAYFIEQSQPIVDAFIEGYKDQPKIDQALLKLFDHVSKK